MSVSRKNDLSLVPKKSKTRRAVCRNSDCGKLFVTASSRKQYCCEKCAHKVRDVTNKLKRVKKPLSIELNMNIVDLGAMSELVASADLLRRGFHVFRSVSPGCPCDLVCMCNLGTTKRVEVRSGAIAENGQLMFNFTQGSESKFDVLAVVLQGEAVVYLDQEFNVFADLKPDWNSSLVTWKEVIDAGLKAIADQVNLIL